MTSQADLFGAVKTLNVLTEAPSFGGSTYDPELDGARLATALARVYGLMRDGRKRSLAMIAVMVGCSEAGASARLRDCRKPRFQAMYPTVAVHAERVDGGLWLYWLTVPGSEGDRR